MLKHEDFMQQTMVNAEGFVFVVDNRHPKFPVAVAHGSTINPEYINLVAGSMLLYRTSQEAVTYLETLIELLDAKGLHDISIPTAAVQATLDSAMKIARDGLPKKSPDAEKSS